VIILCKFFKLYGIDKLSKVVVEDTKFDSPMVAGFDFVEKDPRAETIQRNGFWHWSLKQRR